MNARELMDEFLISWQSGASVSSIERSLISRGYDSKEVEKARMVFEQWVKKHKPWKELKKSIRNRH